MRKALIGCLTAATLATVIGIGVGVAGAAPAAPRAVPAAPRANVVAVHGSKAAATDPVCVNINDNFRILCLLGTQKPFPDCHTTGIELRPLFVLWACGPPHAPAPTDRCLNINGDRNTTCVLAGHPNGQGCQRTGAGIPGVIVYWRCPAPPSGPIHRRI